MDALAFTANLVNSLAWPAAAVLLGLMFRTQLRVVFLNFGERMTHLVKLKAPGTELSFGDEVLAVKSDVVEIALKSADLGDSTDAAVQSFIPGPVLAADDAESDPDLPAFRPGEFAQAMAAHAQTSPRETVLKAWTDLDLTIRRLAAEHDVSSTRPVGADSLVLLTDPVIDVLARDGNLPDPEGIRSAVQRLLALRVSVVHGKTVSKLAAYEYATTAGQVGTLLVLASLRAQASVPLIIPVLRDEGGS